MLGNRRRLTTSRYFGVAFAFVVLIGLAFAMAGRASAQTVSKILCYANPGCTSPTGLTPPALALTPVFYQITITNPGSIAQTVQLNDVLPAGFVAVGAAMCAGGTQTVPVTANTVSGPVVLAANQPSVTCIVNGQFTAAGLMTNTVSVNGSTPFTNAVPVAAPASIPGNVTITKTTPTTLLNVPGIVMYTINVKNTSSNPADPPLVLGNVLTVFDQLRLLPNSVPLHATYVALSAVCTPPSANTPAGISTDCLSTAPATGSVLPGPLLVNTPAFLDFLNWRYPATSAGMLYPGDTMTLKYKVKIAPVPGVACTIQLHADGVDNGAHLALNVPVPSATPQAVQDGNPADNTATPAPLHVNTGFTNQDPACALPHFPPSTSVKVTKKRITPAPWINPPNGFAWTTTVFRYRINVKNISNHIIRNFRVYDETVAGLGTPPFNSVYVNSNCPINGFTACSPYGPQYLAGYSATGMVHRSRLYPIPPTPLNSLNIWPSQSRDLDIWVKYTHPDCDSYPGVTAKRVYNVAFSTSWTEIFSNGPVNVTGLSGMIVPVLMQKPPNCPLQVFKTANKPKIRFGGTGIDYVVKFHNPTPQTYTVGTMIDTVRTLTVPPSTTPYAASLPITYNYTCSRTPGVYGGFSSWPHTVGPTAASILPTALPQQGVRIIQNTLPVTFHGFTTVTCNVHVVVSPPLPSDPYCSMHGYLENAGILDGSKYYNPNFAWPPNTYPGMWAKVQTPLPKCYDLVLNKVPVPPGAWTSQTGGPVTFALSILNNGNDAITGGGPIVADAFTPGLLTLPPPPVATGVPPPPPISATWIAPPTTSSPSLLSINTLAAGQSAVVNFTVPSTAPNQYPAAPGQICNDVTRYMRHPPLGPQPGDYYWKNPASAHACIPVVKTASLTVTKAITGATSAILSNASFTVNVSCQLSSSISGPNTTLTLSITSPSQTINNIPVGSTCSVVETAVPPPHGDPLCNNWVWTPTGMQPASPIVIPQSGATTTVVVTNDYSCQPLSSVVVAKTVVIPGGMVSPAATFTVNVSCHSPTNLSSVLNFTVTVQPPNLTQYTPSTIPAGWLCTVTEVPPPPPIPGTACQWNVTYPQGNNVVINGGTTVAITNTLVCPPVRPAPSSSPNANPAQRFVVGDYIFASKVYNEFSPGNSGSGLSYELRGAVEFPMFGLPWMLEGDYRSYSYPHTSGIAPAVNGNPCPHSGLPSPVNGNPGCVTVIGAYGQTAVPSFTARDTDFDGRFAVKVAEPRIYAGVGYLHREVSYGYPRQNGIGFGAEKLPDLQKPVSAYGSIWYYPSVSGSFTYPAGAPPALLGTSTSLQQSFLKWEIGGTFDLRSSGLFLDAGFKGDSIHGSNASPSDASHAGAYVGIGIKF